MNADRLLLLTPLREALERLEKLEPGLLASRFPGIDWKGAMGFRDVIGPGWEDMAVNLADTQQNGLAL